MRLVAALLLEHSAVCHKFELFTCQVSAATCLKCNKKYDTSFTKKFNGLSSGERILKIG